MTRIDFYVLSEGNAKARDLLACKLTRKAVDHGFRVYLHTESEAQSQALDDLLWQFSQDSFIPHTRNPAELDQTPVLIGHDGEPHGIHDMLINLNAETPACFSRFERMAELLAQEAPILEAGRRRYRFYQDRGYPLNTHKV